jgi:S1-C subfamily serine protease
VKGHPFAPAVLEIPGELKATGLCLHLGKLIKKEPLRVAVAAGEQTGISSGYILRTKEESSIVSPIGNVDNLIALDCLVAPGSSGAPVVNKNMEVIGFIVAGNDRDPRSYMYPVIQWEQQIKIGAKTI